MQLLLITLRLSKPVKKSNNALAQELSMTKKYDNLFNDLQKMKPMN